MPRSIFWRSRLWASSVLRDGQRLGEVAGQQQAQGFLGGFQAAGGVEAGRELEADFVGAEQGRGLGDSLQGDQPGPLGGVQALQAGGDQDAVLAGQRDDVGDGAEGDQVEQRAQVEVGRAGQAGLASALDQGVGEFEGEAGGAEFGEGGGCSYWTLTESDMVGSGLQSKLRIDQRDGGGRGRGDLVMIQHDDVHAALRAARRWCRRRSSRSPRPAAAWRGTSPGNSPRRPGSGRSLRPCDGAGSAGPSSRAGAALRAAGRWR